MHKRVRQTPERVLRSLGALLILLAFIGPLATIRPAIAMVQDGESPDELTEVWRYEGSQFFENDPQVSDGIVLATTLDSLVHVVDAVTGEALWQTETIDFARPYMQVADNVLYTLTGDARGLNAIDITRDGGEERWSVELPAPMDALATPVTEDGLILVLVDGDSSNRQLLALDTADGSEQWAVDVNRFLFGPGLLYSDGVVVVAMEEGLTGLDAATGDQLWQIDLDSASISPVAGDGALYVAMDEGDEIFAVDLASGDERWNVTAPSEFNLPVAVGDGLLFIHQPLTVDDERVTSIVALDTETGEERYAVTSMTNGLATGHALNGLYYLTSNDDGSLDGAIEVYSSEDGTLLARTVMNAKGLAVDPDSGMIYATSSGEDGKLLHAFEPMRTGSGSGGDAGEDEGSAQGNAAPSRDDAPLDLAAMALTSGDINDAELIWQGAQDYGLESSIMMASIDEYLLYQVPYYTVDEDEIEGVLHDAGFVRAYQALYQPMTTADGDDTRMIFAYVIEFADEDGAADAFDYMQNESESDEFTDLDELDQYGDESEGTLVVGESEESGETVAAILDTTVRLNQLIVGVELMDLGASVPDVEDAALLTEAMLDRVEAAIDATHWGLSNQVVRLTGETVSPHTDAYLVRDGEVTLLTRDGITDEDALEEWSAEHGHTGEYRVWQALVPQNDDPDDNVIYYLTVHQFEDDGAAEAWMADRPDEIEEYDDFEEVEFADDDDVDIGDAAFSYTAVSASRGTHFHNITFQVGNLIVVLDLAGPTTPPAEAMLALADAQWTCLEIRNCVEPLELPGALQDFLDDILDGAR